MGSVANAVRHSCRSCCGACGTCTRCATSRGPGRVAGMSAATVDRALRPHRTREGRRGISTTKPGALLKCQIAIRTFADWTDVQPGFSGDGPGRSLWLERGWPVPVHAEHGRCGHRPRALWIEQGALVGPESNL